MTLVLTREPDCPIAMLTSAGLEKIALRVPAHPEAQRLLAAFGGPVAAPSANMSGKISPSRAAHVMQSLAGRIDLVLDGGACENGVESTIIDCTGAQAIILRPGGVTRDEIARVLIKANLDPKMGKPSTSDNDNAPVSPGQLASHYAPNAALRLNALSAATDEILVGFGEIAGSGEQPISLSRTGNLNEAAANLFDLLHQLDALKLPKIAIAPIPDTGLGEAINDRLRRAAAPR
jgi:L-threonylcarbamoyladenylate synthase